MEAVVTLMGTGVSSFSIARSIAWLILTLGRHIALVDIPDLGNRVGPHGHTGGYACHLSGDCDLDTDTALVVNFLELFKASRSYASSPSRRWARLSRINCPSVAIIETDLFLRRFVDNGALMG